MRRPEPLSGLDDLANNLMKWRREPSSYSPEVMKACLDNIRTVLIPHLDQEVHFSYFQDNTLLINIGGGHQRAQIETTLQTGRNREDREIMQRRYISNLYKHIEVRS